MKMSYRDYLRDVLPRRPGRPRPLPVAHARASGAWAPMPSRRSTAGASTCRDSAGMRLEPGSIRRMGFTPAGYARHRRLLRVSFPRRQRDHRAALVRRPLPGACPGDVRRCRHGSRRLRAARPARRAGPPAARQHRGPRPQRRRRRPADGGVAYVRGGRRFTVRARRCVLACYNMMIPYLCRNCRRRRKQALHYAGQDAAGLHQRRAAQLASLRTSWACSGSTRPGGYHTYVALNPPVDIGGYRSPRSPGRADPAAHGAHARASRACPNTSKIEAGRAELLRRRSRSSSATSATSSAACSGPGGFDPARDITAITVNRWPHGYAPEYNPLFDPDVPESQRPHVIGRARFGRHHDRQFRFRRRGLHRLAIDQAHRAVNELLSA